MINEKYPYGLLNDNPKNSASPYIPYCDDETKFKQRLKTMPSDWEYRYIDIEYKYNTMGYRCKDHRTLSNDYILFSGCSFTEGVGLKLEHTYPYLVAQELEKDYYNLGMLGTGPQIVAQNMMLFLALMNKNLPSTVIIQWPDFYRYTIIGEGFTPQHHNSSNPNIPLYRELIEDDKVYYNNVYHRHALLKFLKHLGIRNILELNVQGLEFDIERTTRPKWVLSSLIDKARDLAHPGIKAHQNQAKEILHTIKNM